MLLYSNTKVNKYYSCYLFLSLSGRWVFFNKTYRFSHQGCSVKKVFLEMSQNSQENTCTRDPFLIKLYGWNFIRKESLTQVFSCELSKISKSNSFTELHRTAASKQIITVLFYFTICSYLLIATFGVSF